MTTCAKCLLDPAINIFLQQTSGIFPINAFPQELDEKEGEVVLFVISSIFWNKKGEQMKDQEFLLENILTASKNCSNFAGSISSMLSPPPLHSDS